MIGSVAHLIGQPLEPVPAMGDEIIWRADLLVGAFAGGLIGRMITFPSAAAASNPAPLELDFKELGKGYAAGTSLSLGAMIGGGCTTGAYLAAWPTLSVGSLAMGCTFFAASMLTANMMRWSKRVDIGQVQVIGDRSYD